MSAQSNAVASCRSAAVAEHQSLQVRRFDQWIAEIEGHIEEFEGQIRQLSLGGEDIGPEGFTLQKLELLLQIAREAKSRV